MRTLVVSATVVVAFILLVVLNPGRDDFARFYADHASSDVVRELGLSGPIGDVVGGAAQSLLETGLRERVHRRELWIASIYTVPAGGTDPVYLGVVGSFVRLRSGD